MHGQYNDSKLLWKEKGSAAHMSFQSPALRQRFSSIVLCVSLQIYPLPHPCLWGEHSPHCRSKAASSLQRSRELMSPYCPPPRLRKWQLCYPLHRSFKSILEKFIPFGPSWWIPLTGTFLLVPVSLFSPVRAVPWGFCHNNGSSEMVTEHHLTPRKMGLSHYF